MAKRSRSLTEELRTILRGLSLTIDGQLPSIKGKHVTLVPTLVNKQGVTACLKLEVRPQNGCTAHELEGKEVVITTVFKKKCSTARVRLFTPRGSASVEGITVRLKLTTVVTGGRLSC